MIQRYLAGWISPYRAQGGGCVYQSIKVYFRNEKFTVSFVLA
jgi:hypothetical protein